MAHKPLFLSHFPPSLQTLWHTLTTPRFARYFYALAYTLVLTIALLQSSQHPVIGPAAPPEPPDLPREIALTSAHIIGFSLLTLVWWWAFHATLPTPRALLLAVLIALPLGFITEILQTLVPDRGASLLDMAANWLSSLGMTWMILRSTRG